ncbi:MAG: MBL fold metallo-hydrolase [Clostridia bacterium]
MEIRHLVTGPLSVNTYIVFCKETKQGAVIDPGGNADRIISLLRKEKIILTHILLTHGHFDHIGGVSNLKQNTHATVCIHSLDKEMLTNPAENLSLLMGAECIQPKPDVLLHDGDMLQIGNLEVHVLDTPGHSPGSVTYKIGETLFAGDSIFRSSIGRTDFPGGSFDQLMHSINARILTQEQQFTDLPRAR